MTVRTFFYTLGFALSWLLPLRAAYLVADVLAAANFLFNRRSRRNLTENLRRILPDASAREIRSLVIRNYINFGRNLAEIFRMHRIRDERRIFRFDTESTHLIRKCRESSPAFIFATAHFCNWELSAAPVTEILGELHSIALPDPCPRVNRYYLRARGAIRNHTVPLEKAPRRCLRLLKQGKPLAILSDRSYTGEGIKVDFFGRPAIFPTGFARFGVMFDVPVIPYFIVRTAPGRFKTLTFPPIPVPPKGSREEKIRTVVSRYVETLEHVVKEHPEFWFAFYPFWEESPGTFR